MEDFEETFRTLKIYCIRLNPVKCVFGISFEKLLDLMISHHGIEANPKKLQVVLKMLLPRTRKEVRYLAGG